MATLVCGARERLQRMRAQSAILYVVMMASHPFPFLGSAPVTEVLSSIILSNLLALEIIIILCTHNKTVQD